MKIKIGPYRNWFGPYQCADLLQYVGASKEFCEWLGDKLPEAPFEYFDSFKERKIKIQIDKYDTWGMDHTLAYIIHPMLVQLQATKHGSPLVDDEDVPEELKSTSAPPKENEWDTDDNLHKRWDWVMDEMIFSFETILSEDWEEPYFKNGNFDKEGYDVINNRINNGFRLFGKYYRGLWD